MSHVAPAGRNAIVVLWDENDYSTAPNTNQVMLIVDTDYGAHGVQSAQPYNHFSLLRSLEGGFGLPCLNHACDQNVKVMSDLFSESTTDRQRLNLSRPYRQGEECVKLPRGIPVHVFASIGRVSPLILAHRIGVNQRRSASD